MQRVCRYVMLVATIALVSFPALASGGDDDTWPELQLGDLMKVGIETASRKHQSVSNTAAAAFVISAADIKRSGALSLPEVLRLAPGVEVARLSNNKWAVSIRGFNGRMANKLLVMVDGRSIYSSLYGGVLWEAQDMPLEEIGRIEVIRGSAGMSWGSNAVNGVINIITKRAQETTGWLVDTHAGTSTGKAGMAARYGNKQENGSAFRVTLSEQRRDGGKEVDGTPAQDQWKDSSVSFRYDKPVDGSHWQASGRLFKTELGDPWLVPTFDTAKAYNLAQYGTAQLVPFVSSWNGGNLTGRYEQPTEGGGDIRIQTFVERFQGSVLGATDDRTTMDMDAQHHFPLGIAHDIVWGGNYRNNKHQETLGSTGFLTTNSNAVNVSLVSVFAQDEWVIVPHKFNIQVGARLEKQSFTASEPQTSVRALWTPTAQQSFWLGWSKSSRSPSVVDRTMAAYPGAIPANGPGTLPVLLYAAPGDRSNFGNEKATTIEAGHRAQWTPAFFSDLTVYESRYDGVFGILSQSMAANPSAGFTGLPVDPACAAALTNFGLAAGAPGLCLTMERGNALPVRTRGIELSTEWNPLSNWRLQLNGSRMWLDGGPDNSGIVYGNSPEYQGSLRSSYNFTTERQFDLWLRRIGGLTNTGFFSGAAGPNPIAARTELDLRYAEQVSKSLELSLTLRNLLSKNELQFYPDYMPSLPVVPQRTIYIKALWQN